MLKIFLESVLLDGSKSKFGIFHEYNLSSKLASKQLVWPSQAQPILFEPKIYIRSYIQGVSQDFGHLAKCKFSASEAPWIKILDIFREPGQFWIQNYPYF